MFLRGKRKDQDHSSPRSQTQFQWDWEAAIPSNHHHQVRPTMMTVLGPIAEKGIAGVVAERDGVLLTAVDWKAAVARIGWKDCGLVVGVIVGRDEVAAEGVGKAAAGMGVAVDVGTAAVGKVVLGMGVVGKTVAGEIDEIDAVVSAVDVETDLETAVVVETVAAGRMVAVAEQGNPVGTGFEVEVGVEDREVDQIEFEMMLMVQVVKVLTNRKRCFRVRCLRVCVCTVCVCAQISLVCACGSMSVRSVFDRLYVCACHSVCHSVCVHGVSTRG